MYITILFKRYSILFSFLILYSSLVALDADPRSTREIVLEIDLEAKGTFTAINELETVLCDKFEQTETILTGIGFCSRTAIATAGTIAEAGSYCLDNDITGQISITTNNVTIDGNGFIITAASSTAIDISASTTNVVLKNIAIESGGGNAGINVNAGCSNVQIREAFINNAGTGINFTQVMNSQIYRALIINSTTNGILLTNCANCSIDNSEVLNPAIRGIGLVSSRNLLLTSCNVKELDSPSSSAIGIDCCDCNEVVMKNCISYSMDSATNDAFCFNFDDCQGIVVKNCVASNTETANSDANTNSAGFNLLNSTECTLSNCHSFSVNSDASDKGDGFLLDNCHCILLKECTSVEHSNDCYQTRNNCSKILFDSCYACMPLTGDGFSFIDTDTTCVKDSASKGSTTGDGFVVTGTSSDLAFGHNVALGNDTGFGFDNLGTNTTTRHYFSNFAADNSTNFNVSPSPKVALGGVQTSGVNVHPVGAP